MFSISYFCAISPYSEPSWEDPTVVFKADYSSSSVGDLISGSQNAMISSSISMKERELSSSYEEHSDSVGSSSSSSP